jgi:hypothetical protein
MKYLYLKNKNDEGEELLVFKTKDALIDYLVGLLGDEWRKEGA